MTTKKNVKHSAKFAAKAHQESEIMPSDDQLIQMGVALGLTPSRAKELLDQAKEQTSDFDLF